MGDITAYSLSDFILFSKTTWFRQFELYNQAIWPAHVVAIVFSCVFFYVLLKRPVWSGRLVAGILVVSWLWVAWAFLYLRFYKIHVVANWYAFGFILQAGLIFWFGIIQNLFTVFVTKPWRIYAGSGLLIISLIIYPFIPVMTKRSWLQFEMFALAPDPVVIATLAILLLYRSPIVLYPVPVLWVFLSSVTLFIL